MRPQGCGTKPKVEWRGIFVGMPALSLLMFNAWVHKGCGHCISSMPMSAVEKPQALSYDKGTRHG